MVVLKITNVTERPTESSFFVNLSNVESSVILEPGKSILTEAWKITIGGQAPKGQLYPTAIVNVEVYEKKR